MNFHKPFSLITRSKLKRFMKNRIAVKITLIYFVIGFLWILFSDRFILSLGGSVEATTLMQTYKGWFYICITATLLFFLIKSEIKNERRMLEELNKAKQKAEESDTLKSAFLSNMSHQIRTPLNGILGFCELILDNAYTPEEKEIFAQNMTRNGNDLLKLINDIMDISKIQENQLEIDQGKFDLNQLMDLIFRQYQSEQKSREGYINFVLEKGIPNEVFEIRSDPGRLIIVLQNLLNNAFFFTTEGFIRFGYTLNARGIEIYVEDSGAGIEDANKELIFKPFFTGRQPVIGSKGFGLGLAISKGLVKLLGGDLLFTSMPGKGSRFFFTIEKAHYSIAPEKEFNFRGIRLKEIWYRSHEDDFMKN